MSAPTDTAERLSPRTRGILVWGLIAVGALILLVGSLTLWVKRQATDTDNWVAASSQLLEDDDVRAALSAYVVDQLYRNVDVEDRLEQGLPPSLEALSGPLSGALRTPAEQAVDRILQRPRVQTAWEELNRATHAALLRVLEDETRAGVSTAGGAVTLDLRTLLVDVGTELGFGEQLDSRLPADAGQITVLESEQLETAQTALAALKAGSSLLVVVTLAAFGGALALSRRRRETLRTIGIVVLVVAILLLVIRRVVGGYLVDQLASGESVRSAVDATWLIGTSLLALTAWALVLAGVVVLGGSVLAGPAEWARRTRHALVPTFRDRAATAWLVLGGLYALLVLWGPVPALRSWVGVLLLGALLALGFGAFRRLTLAEAEPAPAAGDVAVPEAPRQPPVATAR